jgi:hypothetical protein
MIESQVIATETSTLVTREYACFLLSKGPCKCTWHTIGFSSVHCSLLKTSSFTSDKITFSFRMQTAMLVHIQPTFMLPVVLWRDDWAWERGTKDESILEFLKRISSTSCIFWIFIGEIVGSPLSSLFLRHSVPRPLVIYLKHIYYCSSHRPRGAESNYYNKKS